MKIKPLSKSNIKGAVKLLQRVFNPHPKDFDYPGKWFSASLDSKSKKSKEIYQSFNVSYLKYYVAIDEKFSKVIGTTGIYEFWKDKKEASWLAWFCVDPEYRGKGIGSKLLAYIIKKAKKRKKKFLRLYTSPNPAEEKAQILYKNRGFKEFKREKVSGKDKFRIYMEKEL